MSRYYFHVQNGGLLKDEEGTDLEHADAARIEAAKLLGQLVAERPEDIWLGDAFTITVKDDAGLTMFLLDLAVTTSSAAPPCRLTRR
ncbi:hypothetical protein [Phenylobacterium sp.]|uniref:DUF6894 family protein n=1 Tax=Phenylobacterium sp. TaxID=1871053 RepID=UPI0011F66A11|nr:hypothetical protein [Phenylobacterium sp.]THD59292.1 MAG: hypothetical protein E8A49_16930 [Phenylobacterium sp.]